MATKLGRMIASLDGLLPIMLHDPLITWSCEILGSLTGGGSAGWYKVLRWAKNLVGPYYTGPKWHYFL